MRINLFLFLSISIITTSCRKDPVITPEESYHILIVAGQSNTHYGEGYDPAIDTTHPQIFQFGRRDEDAYKIIEAKDPLEHHSKVPETIGFAMTFAKLYVSTYMNPNEKLLIIPGAKSGSAFSKNHWNKGNKFYNDLVERVQFVMQEYPASHIAAVLWHQGESDINNNHYRADLDAFIGNFRSNIGSPNVPFILGGMNPNWVNLDEERQIHQAIIKDTPNRHHKTGYADPVLPITIQNGPDHLNSIHFDAAAQRKLGVRYFLAYPSLR